ncbi:MAG: hypothetical protein GY849_14850, partial [Deltaproteobacteria bacterium]|nr:hypothetical protein [Deltaproteobacteria bacterium]
MIRSGGGGGFVHPRQAAEARRWSDFVRAIRSWRPIAAGGGAATLPSSALTVAALEEFARENDRLKPLLPELRASAAA